MTRKLFIVIFVLVVPAFCALSETIVYYDPDGNVKRIFEINANGSKVFNSIGMKFIAAADEKSFRSAMDLKPEFVIVNSLIYFKEKEKFSLDPLYIFTRKGKYVYQKKLVSFIYDDIGALSGRVLSSSLEEAIYTIGGGIKFRLLKVPKDLDALLAIKFRQADAAMVSEDSLDVFKSIDPSGFQNLKFIFSTKGIYNPLVCITKWGNRNNAKKIFNVLSSSSAKELLELMYFDGISDDEKVISKLK